MNLRGFQMGIDRRLHVDEVVVTTELVDERAEIGKTQDSLGRSKAFTFDL